MICQGCQDRCVMYILTSLLGGVTGATVHTSVMSWCTNHTCLLTMLWVAEKICPPPLFKLIFKHQVLLNLSGLCMQLGPSFYLLHFPSPFLCMCLCCEIKCDIIWHTDVTTTDTLVPSLCQNSKNMLVLISLQYPRY